MAKRLGWTTGLSALAAIVAMQTEAMAQPSPSANERFAIAPPTAHVKRGQAGEAAVSKLPGASAAPSETGEVSLDFVVGFRDATLYNAATGVYDKVKLRSYRDAHAPQSAAAPLVGPTIEVSPGDTLRLSVKNGLPTSDPSCPSADGSVNTPHCFNSTNMHLHGLWVSPSGNSDNVLLSINPGVAFQYEYSIPHDHPAGTYWYHPHLHGSTALQVSSGMAGAFVVRGNRLPRPGRTGDIDTLLYYADGKPFRERVVMLQQIEYACRDAAGVIKSDHARRYHCDRGDVGGIEKYDQFGATTWLQSGRHTSLNGQVLPVFADAVAGRIERWRIVHAGVRETIKLQFRKIRSAASTPPAGAHAEWLNQNCTGAPLTQFVIAHDGLTRSAIAEQAASVLQPGYRADLLMVFPEAGSYCVIDDDTPAGLNVNAQSETRKLLGTVRVGSGITVGPSLGAHVATELIAAASRRMPTPVRAKVLAELRNGLSLASFAPHRSIADGEVVGRQTLEFGFSGGPAAPQFQIDGKAFEPARIDRHLALGSVDEWTLTSDSGGHPFHIHVNPFQIVRILDRDGVDVSVHGEANDKQYAGLKGAWRDTIFVKERYKVVVRTRYRRYIGDFVLHCHILDHEDRGMMQNVRISVPDGAGGLTSGHH